MRSTMRDALPITLAQMTAFDPNNPYLRQQVLTATPEKLRLLLLEGCERFLRDGRDAMAHKQWEGVYTNLSSAKDIILELINTMRHEVAPELCAQVSSVLTFAYNHVTDASFEKDIAKLDSCINIMAYERETWTMLMDRATEDRAANPHVPAAVPVSPSPNTPPKPLSLSA